MQEKRQLGVIGSSVFAPRDHHSVSLEEAMFTVTKAALCDAGISIDDIDGIVVASCDQMDGRAISIMAASGSVGGVGRDILSTPSSGEHAFVLASLRVKSGIYQTHLVVSWSPLETDSVNEVQRLSNDPYFHRALPLDDLASHALQANVLESRIPGLHAAAVEVTRTNREHGHMAYPDQSAHPSESVWIDGGKMLRYPISEGMVSKPAFAAVAIVIASEAWIKAHQPSHVAWVHGMGWATETAFLGDRDLSQLPSLVAAGEQAFAQAECKVSDIDLAEVADATPYQQLLSLEALGFCPRAHWVQATQAGEFGKQGRLPVNLSGGALSFNPVFCSGLMRIMEAANQVRGKAGVHQQVKVKKALAHGSSGFAMQYNTVVIFGDKVQGLLA